MHLYKIRTNIAQYSHSKQSLLILEAGILRSDNGSFRNTSSYKNTEVKLDAVSIWMGYHSLKVTCSCSVKLGSKRRRKNGYEEIEIEEEQFEQISGCSSIIDDQL